MKRLIFTTPTAQKIYDDYFKRVNRCIAILSAEDKLEIQMELNSHVYEATQTATPQTEVEVLMDALNNLGMPEEVLQPLVASKKSRQAARTFNPKHILQALTLNITNGIGYVVMAFIYVLTFGFVLVAVMKVVSPANTGMFFKSGELLFFGYSPELTAGGKEMLGNFFIPVVLVLAILTYFLNTLLFRLLKRN